MSDPRPRGRPFVKGQSGNPAGGRPREQTFAGVLRAQLEAVRGKTTTREAMAAVVVEKALRGDLEAIKWIVDRVDGKTPDRLDANVHADLGLSEALVDAVLAAYARSGRPDAGAP